MWSLMLVPRPAIHRAHPSRTQREKQVFKNARLWAVPGAVALTALLGAAGSASAKPIYMPTITKEIQQQRAARAVNPPPPPCPQYGGPTYSDGGCTPLPETPATTLPFPGNMAYYGGHVQVTPKEYLVYWGWGQSGAWPNGTSCSSETITEGSFTATLPCDPDGAGKYMADFVQQMGGTGWAGVQTQYFQTDSSGVQQHITNPTEQLAGVWVDDSDTNTLPATSSSNNPG